MLKDTQMVATELLDQGFLVHALFKILSGWLIALVAIIEIRVISLRI